MPNYKNGKIYKVCNNIENLIYIASTTGPLCMCMAVHRTKAKKNNNANVYKHMNKLGMCNFKIILKLLKRERYYIEIHDKNILLNLNRPIINSIEKHHQHRQCDKLWYIENREYKIKESKKWHLNNKLHVKRYKQKIINTKK